MSRLAKNTAPVYKRTMRRKRLKSIDDIIDAFSGGKKPSEGKRRLAAWAGVSMQAVCNWATEGYVPNGYHYRLHLWSESNGCTLDPAAFGLRKDGSVAETRESRRAA